MRHRPVRYAGWIAAIGVAFAAMAAFAAVPPELLNYQGVLRDSSDRPLSGDYAMVFRLVDAGAGDEILVDSHDAAGAGSVAVSNGLFNVQIGSGTVTDGAGPGVYGSLSEVFRDYEEVLLSVEINGELLSPDVRIVASAYAHNASHLAGLRPDQYLRSDMDNLALGKNWFAGTPVGSSTGGGSVLISPSSANPDDTLLGIGVGGAQRFRLDAEGDTFFVGDLSLGGNFVHLPHGGYLWDNGFKLEFVAGDADTDDLSLVAGNNGTDGSITIVGDGQIQMRAGDGFFSFVNGNTANETALLNHVGTLYLDGQLFLGESNPTQTSIYFNSNSERLSWDTNTGEFELSDDLEVQGRVVATGTFDIGGYFENSGHSGVATIALQHYGIRASGDTAGALFVDSNSSASTLVAANDEGIVASASAAGGYFEDSDDSGYAYAGRGHTGVKGYGNTSGGYFRDIDTGVYVDAGIGSSSTLGNGSKNFAQNHPYDASRVILYSALEGDEVGTYTRGTAVLEGGEARIALGETFAWVTNPDVGLTAQLTPHGDCAGLYVESLSTTELVVRESGGGSSGVAFDYVVQGLRIGFEEVGVVQEKQQEYRIPSMASHHELYEREPGLRRHNALERFSEMAVASGRGPVELSRATELREAIEAYDPEIHGAEVSRPVRPAPTTPEAVAADGSASSPPEPPTARSEVVIERIVENPVRDLESGIWTAVSEAVEAGDVLVLDPENPGALLRGTIAGDAAVAAVAAGPSTRRGADSGTESPVVFAGITECKVDAGYGAVRVGDLLTVSPTAGHAMLALDPLPGTILGKAVEPLDIGTGTIRVLVTLR